MLKRLMGMVNKRCSLRLLCAGLAATGLLVPALAQEATLLPDSPEPAGAQTAAGTGVVTGLVQDAAGQRVSQAKVSLQKSGAATRQVQTDAVGQFRFDAVPEGAWQLTVASAGSTMRGITLQVLGGRTVEVPPVMLSVAGLESMVEVSATRSEIATVQVQLEEKQRILGVLPNFFVSYIDNPAPMTTKQKFSLTTRLEFDPFSIGVNFMVAGIEQATDTFPGYGPGIGGYAKRLGANFADETTANYFAGAIYPTIFHQDPRYFYRGPKYSIKYRLGFALASSVIARSDNGKWGPNYSNVLGDLTAGAISNAYYPSAQRNGAGLTFLNTAIGVGSSSLSGVIQEFLVKKLTPHVPDYDLGAPVKAGK